MEVEPDVMKGIAELPAEAPENGNGRHVPDDAAKTSHDRDADTPWDDFNRTVHFRSMLQESGWKPCGVTGDNEHFTRPGKDGGTSATLRKDGVFYVFTSSAAPLEANTGYDAWGFHVLTRHKGDFKTAAADWRSRMPRGKQLNGAAVTTRVVNEPELEPADLSGWKIVDGTESLKDPPPRPPELIEGICFVGSKTTLAGPSKARKTYGQMHIGLSIATGTPWQGRKVAQGRVLYVNTELGTYSFHSRKDALLKHMGVTLPEGMFDELHLRGKRATIEQLAIFLRAARDGYVLIIIDPIYKLLGKRSENDAAEMADLMQHLESIGDTAGAALLVAHHFAKGNASQKEAMDRASGSGVVARDADALITLTPHEEDDAFTVDYILRDFPPVPSHVVRWEYPVFIPDADLDPAKLKQPGKREAREITDDDVFSEAAFPRERSLLVDAVKQRTGRGVNACRDAVNRVITSGLLKEIRTPRPGTNPLIQYCRKGGK